MTTDLQAHITEKALQQGIIEHARLLGWMVYHTFDSRRSEPGYPDLHMVHPGRKTSMFAEVKSANGRVSEAQIRWIRALREAGHVVHVWRPDDWNTGRIETALRGDTK